MLMTAVVDTRIISMSGRTFFIKANEQKDIPHEFAKEAMAAGAFPVDVKAYKIAEEKKVPVKNDVSYDTPQKLEGITGMSSLGRGDRNWSLSGRRLGWEISTRGN